jgi:hypothetical protein
MALSSVRLEDLLNSIKDRCAGGISEPIQDLMRKAVQKSVERAVCEQT